MYSSITPLLTAEKFNKECSLGIVTFGQTLSLSYSEIAPPVLTIPMICNKKEDLSEIWYSSSSNIKFGKHNEIIYSHDDEYLFCATIIPFLDKYEEKITHIYDELFYLVDKLGYKNIFRIWNYIGGLLDINKSGLQTYQDFVLGRSLSCHKKFGDNCKMPATTAIATQGKGIAIVLLACKQENIKNIENPNQIPAHQYPKQYGPKAPNFARATVLRSQKNSSIFVSGTASIIGHKTVFHNDVINQTKTALDNIETLISTQNLVRYNISEPYDLSNIKQMKVYVKNSDDLLIVDEIVKSRVSKNAQIYYFNVDVCRDELLVEMEAYL